MRINSFIKFAGGVMVNVGKFLQEVSNTEDEQIEEVQEAGPVYVDGEVEIFDLVVREVGGQLVWEGPRRVKSIHLYHESGHEPIKFAIMEGSSTGFEVKELKIVKKREF